MAARLFSGKETGNATRILAFALAWAIALHAMAQNSPQAGMVKIRVTINGTAFTGTLSNNPTAKDFLSLLPLTLTLEDYAATEKIAYPPRKLATAGAPAGSDPSVGDIAYYAPGEISRSSTRMPLTREGSFRSAGSTPASKRWPRPAS
jgi:hypothetical protein